MNALKELRGALVDAVTDVTTYDHVPGRAQLPCAFVMPGNPYLEQGEAFGETRVRFALVLLTNTGSNQDETDALDATILQARRDVQADDWTVESVAAPEIQQLNGAEVLATQINVAALVTLD